MLKQKYVLFQNFFFSFIVMVTHKMNTFIWFMLQNSVNNLKKLITYVDIFPVFDRWFDMSNPSERINYVQDSSSDTETDYKESEGRGRHRLYKNRLR